MNTSILFVHGTGVRQESYEKTLNTIKQQVGVHGLAVNVHGCFWGGEVGAKLLAGGASVPGYADTGGRERSKDDPQHGLWSVLYTDPWYELRLLRNYPEPAAVAPGEEPPAAALRRTVKEFTPPEQVSSAFRDAGLSEYLDGAFVALSNSPEFNEAAQTAPREPLEHRGAIARAVVAWSIIHSEDDGAPSLTGRDREELVTTLTSALKGDALGVSEWLWGLTARLGPRFAKPWLTGHRGNLTDATAPMAGDILRFLAHGDASREYVRAQIEDIRGGPDNTSRGVSLALEGDANSIYLLAHSLGGIICADMLVRETLPGVVGLITVGSQTPFLYEIGAFPGLSHPYPLPPHMPPWLNVYDRNDILSYLAAPVFPGQSVKDVEVDNGQPFPQSHSAYWTNPQLWAAIKEFLT